MKAQLDPFYAGFAVSHSFGCASEVGGDFVTHCRRPWQNGDESNGGCVVSVSVQVGKAAVSGFDWTAASTIVAAAAAIIALYVGVWPIWQRRRVRIGQARFWAKVAVDDLVVQELNLLAATKIVTQPEGYARSWQYNEVARCTATLNNESLITLAQYRECLPKEAETALAVAISILSAAQNRRVFLAQLAPGEVVNLKGDVGWYKEVYDAIHPARVELAKWAGVDLQPVEEGAAQLAANLRLAAQAEQQIWTQAKDEAARATTSERDWPSR